MYRFFHDWVFEGRLGFRTWKVVFRYSFGEEEWSNLLFSQNKRMWEGIKRSPGNGFATDIRQLLRFESIKSFSRLAVNVYGSASTERCFAANAYIVLSSDSKWLVSYRFLLPMNSLMSLVCVPLFLHSISPKLLLCIVRFLQQFLPVTICGNRHMLRTKW